MHNLPLSSTLELWEVLTWSSEGIWPAPHWCSQVNLLFLCCVGVITSTCWSCSLLLIFQHHQIHIWTFWSVESKPTLSPISISSIGDHVPFEPQHWTDLLSLVSLLHRAFFLQSFGVYSLTLTDNFWDKNVRDTCSDLSPLHFRPFSSQNSIGTNQRP